MSERATTHTPAPRPALLRCCTTSHCRRHSLCYQCARRLATMADQLLPALAAALLCFALAPRVAQCGGGGRAPPQNYTSMFSFGDSLTEREPSRSRPLSTTSSAATLRHHLLPPHRPLLHGRPRRRLPRCVPWRRHSSFISPLLRFRKRSASRCWSRTCSPRARISAVVSTSAVGGATAMDAALLPGDRRVPTSSGQPSLSVQLGWFEQLKPSLCDSPQSEDWGNDYNYAFFKGKTLDDAKTYVPTVAGAVTDATERLIKAGAMHLVVPGNLPIGCSSAYLTLHPGRNRSDYDSAGCLKDVQRLRAAPQTPCSSTSCSAEGQVPAARIMYADYYGAAMSFAKNPKQFGFTQGPLRTCCGGGGPYNFNPKASCGVRGSSVCTDPSAYANWDGVHLTEAAYHAIADSILNGPYTSPRLL
ncbi:hypothetical protein HU200_066644 [Digitaria exilis]|uniref:GDSL esterase/lipase n=1 Tax=Digitaria exilis TaxID=1010633 RepID=A0A834ZXH6_9POAL|nr:hypothetical protein HU200_066644 [Digitaria exilis]